jgi:imidazoleglycerol-phosphate dehydratase
MLDQIARHGMFDLEVEAKGDLHIDAHHTVEDVGITLGQAFARRSATRRACVRYGHAYVPLDEALSRVVVDLSGRPGARVRHVPFTRAMIGEFDVDLCASSSRASSITRAVTLHVDNLRGDNAHHQARRCSRRSPARCAWRSSSTRACRRCAAVDQGTAL